MTETYSITIPVLTAVSKLGMFWRQNTGTFRTMDGARVIRATSIDGVADIMGCYQGRAVAIETKTLTGKLRQTQIVFRRQWEKSGGVYIVARCIQDALDGLTSISVDNS